LYVFTARLTISREGSANSQKMAGAFLDTQPAI